LARREEEKEQLERCAEKNIKIGEYQSNFKNEPLFIISREKIKNNLDFQEGRESCSSS
jgi:hypothetical protein